MRCSRTSPSPAYTSVEPVTFPIDRLVCWGRYYQAYNPAFANQAKCEGIVRTFRAKAKKAGEPGAWKEMLYSALAAKDGCDDPREVLARAGKPGAEPEPEPEPDS